MAAAGPGHWSDCLDTGLTAPGPAVSISTCVQCETINDQVPSSSVGQTHVGHYLECLPGVSVVSRAQGPFHSNKKLLKKIYP